MKKKILKFTVLLSGLFLIGLGIALITKANIGTTPISVIPLLLSGAFPISFGMVANILNLSFIVMEFFILGRIMTKELVGQLLITPFFGFFIDLGFSIVQNMYIGPIINQILISLVGCIVLSLGVSIHLSFGLAVNPFEGLVKSISDKINISFSNVKITMDIGILMLGLVLSLSLFGDIRGLGIGTVLAAFFTGIFIMIFTKISGLMKRQLRDNI